MERRTRGPISFGKLASAARLARVDFGVELDFRSLRPLKRDPKNPQFVTGYFAAGKIRYPAARGHTEDEGVLVVIKAGLVEDQSPVDILNYVVETDPGFPSCPTQDLQYDQPQFESLRQPGYVAGDSMCHAGADDGLNLSTETVEARFRRVLRAYEGLASQPAVPEPHES